MKFLSSRPDTWLQHLDRLAPHIWKSMDGDRKHAHRWSKDMVLPSWASRTHGLVLLDALAPKDGMRIQDIHPHAPLQTAPLLQKGARYSDPVLLLTQERAAMFYSWRATKLEFRFDPDFAKALMETPIQGDIPPDLLRRLPASCIYLDLQGLGLQDYEGVFVLLDSPSNKAEPILKIFQDSNRSWPRMVFSLSTNGGSLADFMEQRGKEFEMQLAKSKALGQAPENAEEWLDMERKARMAEQAILAKLLSLLLYLCSEEPDVESPLEPIAFQEKRIGDLRRILPPKEVRNWPVGVRLGALFRKKASEDAIPLSDPSTVVVVRPHIRRAHWHTYRSGPRGTIPLLKWLSPIVVGARSAGDALPTVVHPVQKEKP